MRRLRLSLPSTCAIGLCLIVLGGCAAGEQAAQQTNQKIIENTDMGLDNMTKSRDKAVESQILSGIASDPWLANVKDLIEITVSHNVVVITGRVKTQEQKDSIEKIVKNAVNTAGVKEYELKVEIDDTIPELPFAE